MNLPRLEVLLCGDIVRNICAVSNGLMEQIRVSLHPTKAEWVGWSVVDKLSVLVEAHDMRLYVTYFKETRVRAVMGNILLQVMIGKRYVLAYLLA